MATPAASSTGDRGDIRISDRSDQINQRKLLLLELLKQGVLQHRRADQKPIDLAGSQGSNLMALSVQIRVGVNYHGSEAAFANSVVDSADDRREQGIGQIRDDYAEQVGLACLQAARVRVGHVP